MIHVLFDKSKQMLVFWKTINDCGGYVVIASLYSPQTSKQIFLSNICHTPIKRLRLIRSVCESASLCCLHLLLLANFCQAKELKLNSVVQLKNYNLTSITETSCRGLEFHGHPDYTDYCDSKYDVWNVKMTHFVTFQRWHDPGGGGPLSWGGKLLPLPRAHWESHLRRLWQDWGPDRLLSHSHSQNYGIIS